MQYFHAITLEIAHYTFLRVCWEMPVLPECLSFKNTNYNVDITMWPQKENKQRTYLHRENLSYNKDT